ncbi:hypothetical protein BaRGS_00031563 [Batillaria attramentaria]|uniref:N-acetyltransferase domain-containing protein n=1 Tax=Batillaria attramentaria TaxID=370345 RepID=A0ABD0JRF6_9CAEN
MSHGGDPTVPSDVHTRRSGWLVALSGATGKQLGTHLAMPEDRETYCAPTVHTRRDGSQYILYGSGGETVGGQFLAISMTDFYRHIYQKPRDSPVPNVKGDYRQWGFKPPSAKGEISIFVAEEKGVMVPPVMVDMNRDGVKDILMNSFDGNMVLFDGETLESCGRSSSRAGSPTARQLQTVIVDGRDGTVLWNMTTVKYDVTSDLIARTGAKNRDVFLFRAQGRRGRDPMERGAIHGATGIQRVVNYVECESDQTVYIAEFFALDRTTMAQPIKLWEKGSEKHHYQLTERDQQKVAAVREKYGNNASSTDDEIPWTRGKRDALSKDDKPFCILMQPDERTTVCHGLSDAQRQKVDYEIRQMRRGDLNGLYALLAENKWNMERDYLECVFDTDPSGLLVVLTEDGHVIGHNGILAHGDHVASSGMNIVKEQYRELGIGRELFKRVMGVMRERNVGGTSLSNRISFYAQFGWTIPSYTLHYNQGPVNPDFINTQPKVDGLKIVPVTEELFEDVLGYDSELHTVPRPKYLHNWVMFHKAKSFAALKNGKVCGYSVLRPSDVGFKMYPLFADDKNVAHALFCKMASFVPDGQDVIFTQPIENEEATKFVEANKFTNYLSMTRLYNKWNIDVDVKRVFSTSSTKYAIV